MIKIKNLNKSFTVDKQVLNVLTDINLEVEKEDIYGIIGVSGAGKSTLIRIIAGLETYDSGEAYVLSKDILKNINDVNYRRQIGFITQNYSLLMQKTVLDNVKFPLEIAGKSKEECTKRALEMLELVGISEKANVYPAKLSGGQRQRVAIARALANNPSLLLCDEPTSALDSMTTNKILSLLKKINQELSVTIVMITHNMSVVKKICNKVAVIDASKIVESGIVSDVLENPKSSITKEFLGGE